MYFTLDDLRNNISDGQFQLGLDLFERGTVTAPNVVRGGELVTAVLYQGGGKPFRVYVRVRNAGTGGKTIQGECSCAVGKNCLHVAAVMLQALRHEGALPETAPATVPIPSLPTAKVNRPRPQERVLYTFKRYGNNLEIKPLLVRLLADGRFGQSHTIDAMRINTAVRPPWLNPPDTDLLSTLARIRKGLPVVPGKQAGELLPLLLATGRCYYDTIESPVLALGAPRPVLLRWKVESNGMQHLEWSVQPAAGLLPIQPFYYLDMENALCGPITSTVPPDLLQKIYDMPELPPELISETTAVLRQRFPDHAIPAPVQLKTVESPVLKPVPCLRLTCLSGDESSGVDTIHYASLYFDYGDIRLDRSGPPTYYDGTQVWHIRRHKGVERRAAATLRRMGLVERKHKPDGTEKDGFFVQDRRHAVRLWLDFQLEQVPALRQLGWRIEFNNAFPVQWATPQSWFCETTALQQADWFQLSLGVEIDGEKVDLVPLLMEFLSDFSNEALKDSGSKHFILKLPDGRLLPVPMEKMQALYALMLEFHNHPHGGGQARTFRINRLELAKLDGLEDTGALRWYGDAEATAFIERLRQAEKVPHLAPPEGFQALLRPYQQRGLDWLQFLRATGLSGILADDMGLGKTVQSLAHLLLEKQQGRLRLPCMVVTTTSLVFNWEQEARRFAPQLKLLILQGQRRQQYFKAIGDCDVVITTYPLLVRDEDVLMKQSYHVLILDEAQWIKNPKTKASRVARRLTASFRLCLTGTPLENHLGELWSLFDFLLPGLLGDEKLFRKLFRIPIEQRQDTACAERLRKRIRPFLLRRTKQTVARELPPKTEMIRTVVLSGAQRELYESIRMATLLQVRRALEKQGLARSHIVVLDALLKLRQVCCDPRLLNLPQAKKVPGSAKLELCMQLLTQLVDEGRSLVLFSQFTSMLDIIAQACTEAGIAFVTLTGRTRNRAKPVEQFQKRQVSLFLISLKAGGVGLNLTAADTVIHYDPWWNPAVERQATDRAHRIGQTQPVFVYKLICEGTVEEKIKAMQERKQLLADGVYDDQGISEPRWTAADLEQLFAPISDTVR